MKPHVFKSENGETVIEWIAKDRRFSLWFGEEPCWTYTNRDGTIESGDLTEDILSAMSNSNQEQVSDMKEQMTDIINRFRAIYAHLDELIKARKRAWEQEHAKI